MIAFALAMLVAIDANAPVASARSLSGEAPALPYPSVVVLWASWCVSCRTELERLPKLAEAASPLPIVTLAIDPPATATRVLSERHMSMANAFADGRNPRSVLDAWGGPGSALPVAVAIDRQGRVCGRKLGLLGTDQLREWAGRCSR